MFAACLGLSLFDLCVPLDFGSGDLRFTKDLYTNSDDYTHARRLIRALLEPNVQRRLGCQKRGATDIKESPFFSDVSVSS